MAPYGGRALSIPVVLVAPDALKCECRVSVSLKPSADHSSPVQPPFDILWRLVAILSLAAASIVVASVVCNAGGVVNRDLVTAGADLAALARGELSLGLTADPYVALFLPPWDDVSALSSGQPAALCGVPIALRLPAGTTMVAPLDLAIQHRVPIEFCPDYWPEHQPGKTLADFCADEYFGYWPLEQNLTSNPFDIARREIDYLNHDHAAAQRRWALALAHFLVNGRSSEAASSAAIGALAGENALRNDIALEVATDAVLKLLPESLWKVTPDETSFAIDLHVRSSLSYDTAVSMSRMLRLAAQ